MSNETVTYSLEAVLTRIEGKIDSLLGSAIITAGWKVFFSSNI